MTHHVTSIIALIAAKLETILRARRVGIKWLTAAAMASRSGASSAVSSERASIQIGVARLSNKISASAW